jgi:hypothetical protein
VSGDLLPGKFREQFDAFYILLWPDKLAVLIALASSRIDFIVDFSLRMTTIKI